MKVKVRKAMFYIDDMTCDATLDCAFKTVEEAIDCINNELIPASLANCMHYSAYRVWTRVRLGFDGDKTVYEVVVNHEGKYNTKNLVNRIEYLEDGQNEFAYVFGHRSPYIDVEIERLKAELTSIQAV